MVRGCAIILAWIGCVYAASELWVVYHPGCARCDAFLNEVVPTYPNHHYAEKAVMPSLRLLNVSFPEHQKEIKRLNMLIFSTPYFLLVEQKAQDLKIWSHWKGFSNPSDFYHALNRALLVPKA